MMLASFAKD